MQAKSSQTQRQTQRQHNYKTLKTTTMTQRQTQFNVKKLKTTTLVSIQFELIMGHWVCLVQLFPIISVSIN